MNRLSKPLPRNETRPVEPSEASFRGERPTTARSVAYALFSRLVTSPSQALRGAGGSSEPVLLPPEDLRQISIWLRHDLPFDPELEDLAAAAEAIGPEDGRRLAQAYGSLFEVGSAGPPVPLREGWAEGIESSAREEVVRFYDFFGYELAAESSWEADHLAVELEFMHFLIYAEQQASRPEVALSYQLAQIDFIDRHLWQWLPTVIRGVEAKSQDVFLRALFSSLGRFVEHDYGWQAQSLGREV